MKVSENWLREWVNPPVSSDELSEQLTSLGLEVDSVDSALPTFSDVVIARVVSVNKHPDADRLRVCEVDNGTSDLLQVVCGAPNVSAGLTTVLANVGSAMSDGKVLKKAKLRGVESHGMLCSAAELGLSDQKDGLIELSGDAPVGESLAVYLELNDSIINLEITPDRGDCFCVRGLARDLSARNDMPMQLHEITPIAAQHQDQWPVNVTIGSACARFAGRVIKDVDLSRTPPVWLVERLRRSGVRSINPIVDITNYVMLELGQPMHAYDLDKLQGSIQVRLAGEGEEIQLLDGRDITLSGETTVIADDSGAIGLAGIMGGSTTAVDEHTKHVFLEAALFLPEKISGKPRFYAANTESSHRFERGVDPALQADAIEYATGLCINLAGGKPGPLKDWQDSSQLPKGEPTLVRASRIQRILGIPVPADTVESIALRLGIDYQPVEGGWMMTPPSYRYDIRIEEDFIEEVGRVFGFDNMPRTSPSYTPIMQPKPETAVPAMAVKQLLAHRGFQEVVTYSFVDNELQNKLRPDLQSLALSNPISSELSVMRTTLIAGLIDTLKRNQARQQVSMKLFETGLRFVQLNGGNLTTGDAHVHLAESVDIQINQELQQQSMIAGLIAGSASPEGWAAGSRDYDFYDMKADLEALFAQSSGREIQFDHTDIAMLHPGQRVGLRSAGELVGYAGRLNPNVQSALDLAVAPYVFELALSTLSQAQLSRAQPLSRFPRVRRDIALMVDADVTHEALVQSVRRQAPEWLVDVLNFDVYDGEKVEKGKKSIALGLIMQDFSRTLEEAEVEQAVARILEATSKDLGAVLRV